MFLAHAARNRTFRTTAETQHQSRLRTSTREGAQEDGNMLASVPRRAQHPAAQDKKQHVAPYEPVNVYWHYIPYRKVAFFYLLAKAQNIVTRTLCTVHSQGYVSVTGLSVWLATCTALHMRTCVYMSLPPVACHYSLKRATNPEISMEYLDCRVGMSA